MGSWVKVWHRAFINVPHRVRYVTTCELLQLSEPIPIGEFIAGEAKGKLRLVAGKVCEVHITGIPIAYGQQALLTKLLGYTYKRHNGKVEFNDMRVWHNMNNGHAPKDKHRRKLLLALANLKTGPALGRKLVRQRGWAKRYGLSERD